VGINCDVRIGYHSLFFYTVNQGDPSRVVQSFIDLVGRHEQSFYSFVHKVHSKGQSLFDSLMHWIELFLTAVREGLGEKISLEFLLPHTGSDRSNILKEVDAVALYHYKLKVLYEEKVRKRFVQSEGGDTQNADAEDEVAQELVNGVIRDFSFGELVRGDVNEINAAEEDEDEDEDYDSDSDSEESSEYETATESGSESSEESVAHKPIARSATIAHPPVPHDPRSHHQQHHPRRHETMMSPLSPHSPVHSNSQRSTQTRGRDARRDETQEPRSRSRSLHRIKSLLSVNKKTAEVPPVPALPPKHFPSAPLPRHMTSSPSRSSVDSLNSQRRRPPPSGAKNPPKRRKQAIALKPPELEHVPNLLPVFIEMVSTLCIASE
jgi:hypothetical protein